MNWWFFALAVMGAIGVGIHIANHGKKREDEYHGGFAFIINVFRIILIYFAIRVGWT